MFANEFSRAEDLSSARASRNGKDSHRRRTGRSLFAGKHSSDISLRFFSIQYIVCDDVGGKSGVVFGE